MVSSSPNGDEHLKKIFELPPPSGWMLKIPWVESGKKSRLKTQKLQES